MHPVKQETFATECGINIDPKGFHRVVDTYHETQFGLYMARGADHPQFGYLESWLLPDLSLRVSIFHYRPGYERPQDYYIDIVDISRVDINNADIKKADISNLDAVTSTIPRSLSAETTRAWHTRDLYVDIVSLTGKKVDVLDIDELAEATAEGLISAEDAEHAIEATLRAVEGITRHDDNVLAWLDSLNIPISWADPATIELTPPLQN